MENIFIKYPNLNEAFNDNNFTSINIGNSDICYVFITGNTINPRKAEQNYYKENKDIYEWQNISKNAKIQNHAGKIIYIKDVSSKFYLYGINHNIDSIDKIVHLLITETKGYKVYLVGFSAGAYLSLILSTRLQNVVRVLAFGPVINLLSWKGATDNYQQEDIDYFALENRTDKTKYFNINSLTNEIPNCALCFGGIKSADLVQYNELKERKLNYVWMQTDKHCGEISGNNLIHLLTCSNKKIKKLIKNKMPLTNGKLLFKLSKISYLKNKVKKLLK